jgi:hypothetical protein
MFEAYMIDLEIKNQGKGAISSKAILFNIAHK